MRNFDIVSKILWEGLKNPKDNPCWKGYKPVGTKKKNGRTVPNCVPKESKKKLTKTLKESRFQVTGEIIFRNPNGTGPKHQGVNTTIQATTKEQAVFLVAKIIANQKKFGNSYYHQDRGYRVVELPDAPSQQLRLPYKDDE